MLFSCFDYHLFRRIIAEYLFDISHRPKLSCTPCTYCQNFWQLASHNLAEGYLEFGLDLETLLEKLGFSSHG